MVKQWIHKIKLKKKLKKLERKEIVLLIIKNEGFGNIGEHSWNNEYMQTLSEIKAIKKQL
jgi:hypothetical protein